MHRSDLHPSFQAPHALANRTLLHSRYEIEGALGCGNSGIVYRAFDRRKPRSTAIREYIPVGLAIRDSGIVRASDAERQAAFENGLRRFCDRAESLARLDSHPNIVQYTDFFRLDGTAYLVMKFEHGVPLSEHLKKREYADEPLDERDLIAIIEPVLQGLDTVHNRGLVHGKIEPNNILIRYTDKSPVLVDFCTIEEPYSTAMDSDSSPVSGYIAPEKVVGGELGPWTDLYAIGAIMWRIVVAQNPPWHPPDPTPAEHRMEEISRQKKDPLPSVQALRRAGFSIQILKAIDQCLAVKACDRPQHLAELLTSIRIRRRLLLILPNLETWMSILISGCCVILGVISMVAMGAQFRSALIDLLVFGTAVNLATSALTNLSNRDAFKRSPYLLQIVIWICPILTCTMMDVLYELETAHLGVGFMLIVGRKIIYYSSATMFTAMFGMLILVSTIVSSEAAERLEWDKWKIGVFYVILLCGLIVLFGIDARTELWRKWHLIPGVNSAFAVFVGSFYATIILWLAVPMRRITRLLWNRLVGLLPTKKR